MKPRVSVVMPAFNAENTVMVALDSVFSQTMPDLEVIVCNDGSTDETASRLASISDSRLKVITNPSNYGGGSSRDLAIREASADWVAVMDADDVWTPDRLETLLAATREGEQVLVFDDLIECHDLQNGQLSAFRRLRGPGAIGCPTNGVVDVDFNTFILQSRVLIKPIFPASVVRKHAITHQPISYGEDTGYFLRLIAAGCGLRYVDRAMYLYRLTPGSANANPMKHRLMRESVEGCLRLEGFSETDRAALARKVQELRKNEAYAETMIRLRSNHLRTRITAARELLSTPWMLGKFARRMVDDSVYQVHRVLHGGRGRR